MEPDDPQFRAWVIERTKCQKQVDDLTATIAELSRTRDQEVAKIIQFYQELLDEANRSLQPLQTHIASLTRCIDVARQSSQQQQLPLNLDPLTADEQTELNHRQEEANKDHEQRVHARWASRLAREGEHKHPAVPDGDEALARQLSAEWNAKPVENTDDSAVRSAWVSFTCKRCEMTCHRPRKEAWTLCGVCQQQTHKTTTTPAIVIEEVKPPRGPLCKQCLVCIVPQSGGICLLCKYAPTTRDSKPPSAEQMEAVGRRAQAQIALALADVDDQTRSDIAFALQHSSTDEDGPS